MTATAPFEARIAGAFLRGYRWIAGLIGGFNALIAFLTLTMSDLPYRIPMGVELGVASLGYLAFAAYPWPRVATPERATAAYFCLAAWSCLDALASVRVAPDPLQFLNFVILFMATGFAYPRRLNHILGLLLAALALTLAGGPPVPREVWGTALLLASMLSVCLNILVRRLISELALLHAKDMQLVADLQASMDQVKALQGLVPICSYCKQVRNDEGYWEQVEAFVESHSAASFTHGVCPACEHGLRAEFEAELPASGGFRPPEPT
jgi:hypothetical protein